MVYTLVFTFLQLKAIILRGFWFSTALSAISDILLSLPILKNPVNLIYSYLMFFDGFQCNWASRSVTRLFYIFCGYFVASI